jgi:hypothetical protein
MKTDLRAYIEQVTDGICQRALTNLIGKAWPGVILLDDPLHENGQRCGDETCPCAQDPSFTERVVETR